MDDLIELTCREVVELMTDYLGDALTPAERACLEQHLLVCPPCTGYLGQLRATVELAGLLGAPAPTGDIDPELLRAFRDRKPR